MKSLGFLLVLVAATPVLGKSLPPGRVAPHDPAPHDPASHDPAANDPAIRRARALFDEGTRHYRVGEFKEALQNYKDAYLAKPSPAFLYNMAQCYRQMHLHTEAAREYRAFLADSPQAPNRVEIERLIAESEAAARADLDAERARAASNAIAPNVAVSPVPPLAAAAVKAEPDRQRIFLGSGIAALALGMAGIGSGAALAAIDGNGACTLAPPSQQCKSVYDTQALGIGLAVGGGVLAVAGAALTWLGVRHPAQGADRKLSLAPLAAPNLIGFSAQGAF